MKDIFKILVIFVPLALMLSLPLGACGIKPKTVDAPQGNDKDSFPRSYPAK